MKTTSTSNLFAEAMKSEGFWLESVKLEFACLICREMDNRGWSKKDLAKLLQCSKGSVKQIMDGRITLKGMVRVCHKMGLQLKVSIEPINYPKE